MTEPAGVPPNEQPWEPTTPQQAAEVLRGLAVPWMIAGGWALDLFIGRQTRAHGDLDISIFRGDEAALQGHLRGWELFIAETGSLAKWEPGAPFPSDRHAIWARMAGHERWQLEIAVERRDGTRWSYRRDASVGAHVADVARRTSDGIPYLRPDIVLLYKSKAPRGLDETDFITVLPHLDAGQRGFLAAALWTVAPGHRWLERLK